jgi:cell division protein ZapA (FtsZ GTPase activity inhibitor)
LEQKLKINIFGKAYLFKTETEATKAKKIAAHLEKEVAKVESQQTAFSGQTDRNVVLISAALNILNEYFDLKDTHNNLLNLLSDRTSQLIEIIDKK